MADVLYVFDTTVAASVLPTAPVETQLVQAGQYQVVKVTIVIPDGHSGLTGIALGYGHQPVIPLNAGAYISGNDEVFQYLMGSAYPSGVPWSVFLCNNDIQSHTFETRWELIVSPVTTVPAQPTTIPPAQIIAAASPGVLGP